MGHSPKRVLAWGPRRDTRPAGERRSGGALGGCLSHRDSNPTWSEARDAAYAQKERPAGEAYRSSPCGDSATPPGPHKSANKYINPQFVKIPYACACARARAAACALGCAREALPQKFPPQSTRKNGAVPPGSAGQKQENKNFSKKFAQTGRNLPPRLRIILVEGFAPWKRPPIPQKFAFCTEMTHQGETI